METTFDLKKKKRTHVFKTNSTIMKKISHTKVGENVRPLN